MLTDHLLEPVSEPLLHLVNRLRVHLEFQSHVGDALAGKEGIEYGNVPLTGCLADRGDREPIVVPDPLLLPAVVRRLFVISGVGETIHG